MSHILTGDCLDHLRTMPEASVDAIVTDPPYGLSFMGKRWDYDVPSADIWRECLRVLKPGGHLLAFAGTRTQHRMAVNIEDAGFEIRDMIAWVYGCLSDDSEVLTRDGWERYHTARHKEILAYDAEADVYQWERPSRWSEYRVESDTAFRIRGESDQTDQIVSRGHRCLVERGGTLAFVPANELAGMERVPYLQGDVSSLPQGRGALLLEAVLREGERRPQAVRTRPTYRTTLATVTPIEYTGLIFCPTVSTGAFVARRNGKVFVTGNSGFPKSLDVSKAIDKAAGAEREVIGPRVYAEGHIQNTTCGEPPIGTFKQKTGTIMESLPATDAARQWAGWGTALKPAMEPITVARKPLCGTVAENVLAHGTGAINVDGCRVGTEDMSAQWDREWNENNGEMGKRYGQSSRERGKQVPLGRWPANLILSYPEDEYELRGDVTPEQLRQLAGWLDANG